MRDIHTQQSTSAQDTLACPSSTPSSIHAESGGGESGINTIKMKTEEQPPAALVTNRLEEGE